MRFWILFFLALLAAGCSGGTDTVSLTATTPVSVLVSPGNPTLAPGATVQMSLLSTDGRDFTTQATWASSDPDVATVSATGLVTATTLGGGQTLITASSNGLSTGTTVTVTGARLLAVTVNPGRSTTIVGFHRPLIALGTFEDGTVQNITSSVTWSSANPAVATVSAAGRLDAVALGETTVTAAFGTLSATVSVDTSYAALASLLVAPTFGSGGNPRIATGDVEGFTAAGQFEDGTVLDLTEDVAWTSSNPANAPVSASGEVTGNVAGTYTITATQGAISADRTLTVLDGAPDYTERRVPFDWQDIRYTGQLLALSDDQSVRIPEGRGFAFTWFGTLFDADELFASTNGFLSFGPEPSDSNEDGALPNVEAPVDMAALYWGDQVTAVYYQEFGTAPNRTAILQWVGSPWSDPALEFAVQAVLVETANTLEIRYLRPTAEYGSGATDGTTVGVQNGDGTVGTTHSNREPALFENSAWRYAP